MYHTVMIHTYDNEKMMLTVPLNHPPNEGRQATGCQMQIRGTLVDGDDMVEHWDQPTYHLVLLDLIDPSGNDHQLLDTPLDYQLHGLGSHHIIWW